MDNFEQIQSLPSIGEDALLLKHLSNWSEVEHQKNLQLFDERRRSGYVRECHGDLHLNNIVLLDGQPTAFDGIEFNDELRWIDVMSEIAYVAMDLVMHGQKLYASRFLNQYLQITGDYAGLAILQYYLVYRALVVAKVRKIKALQQAADSDSQKEAKASFFSYLQFASKLISKDKPRLIVMHGYSASGKSTIAAKLAELMQAIQIRSDVERKRLHGIELLENTHSKVSEGIYTTSASRQTYAKLAELAENILRSGYSVIVDACFLQIDERRRFYAIAEKLQVTYVVLSCHASIDELRKRIIERKHSMKDPSEADVNVLNSQIKSSDSLDARERKHCLIVDTQDRQFTVEDLLHNIEETDRWQTG